MPGLPRRTRSSSRRSVPPVPCWSARRRRTSSHAAYTPTSAIPGTSPGVAVARAGAPAPLSQQARRWPPLAPIQAVRSESRPRLRIRRGHKPTYDLVSRRGVAALSWTLDHVGRSRAPSRVLRSCWGDSRARRQRACLAGPVGEPAATSSSVFPRFGVRPGSAVGAVGIRRDLHAPRRRRRGLVEVSVPELEESLALEFAIVIAEAASYYNRDLRERSSLIGEGIRTLFQSGAVLPSEDYLHAQRLRSVLCRRSLARSPITGSPQLRHRRFRSPRTVQGDTEVVIDGESSRSSKLSFEPLRRSISPGCRSSRSLWD